MRPRLVEAWPDSPNWIAARRGCLTASRMADAMAFLKTGKPTVARTDYMREIVAERIAGFASERYVTGPMQWGIENEPKAREEYEIITGRMVEPAGFVLHPSIEFFGATPDNFCGDGLVEYKCPQDKTFLAYLQAGIVPEDYKPQMIAQLVCCEAEWCDFVAFHPHMPPGRRAFVRRFVPTAEERKAVEDAARRFLDEVEQMFEICSTMEMAA